MSEQNKHVEKLRSTLLFCSLLCLLFYFFTHNFSSPKKNPESVKHYESVFTGNRAAISEKQVTRIFKPLPFSVVHLEFLKKNFESTDENIQPHYLSNDFSQIKTLLSQSIYHQYFASGLHDLPSCV